MATTTLRDYYGILGVAPTATEDEIRHAYRRLAKLWHPDRYRAAPEHLREQAERRMRLLTEAHRILGDPARRAIYDRERRLSGYDQAHGHTPHAAHDHQPATHPMGEPVVMRPSVTIPGYQPSSAVGASTVGQDGLSVFAGLLLGFLALAIFSGASRSMGYGAVNPFAMFWLLVSLGMGVLAALTFFGEGPLTKMLRLAGQPPPHVRYRHQDEWQQQAADLSRFEELVRQAIDDIPAEFAEQMGNLAVFVEAEPSPAVLRRMEVKPGWTLLGLYEGVPLTKQGAYQAGAMERITLYQGPIERHALYSPARIEHQIKATLLHELAHHFGMDHDEMPIWVKA